MKTSMFLTVTISILLLAGCYTQLGTVRNLPMTDEERYEAYQPGPSEDDTEATPDYDTPPPTRRFDYDDYYYDRYEWYPRYRWYFSYYYPSYYWPSTTFAVAYGNPWYYDCYWWYDPWICGTPYVTYRYYPGWYGHYYSYYPYRYQSYYVSGGGGVRTNRDFGSTRGRSVRTGGGGRGSAVSGVGGTERSEIGVTREGTTRGDAIRETKPVERTGGRRDATRSRNSERRQPVVRQLVPVESEQNDGRRSEETRSSDPGSVESAAPAVRETEKPTRRTEPVRVGTRRESSPPHSTPAVSSPPRQSSPPPVRSEPSRGSGSSGGGSRDSGRSGPRR
jgi:hypothetical protein